MMTDHHLTDCYSHQRLPTKNRTLNDSIVSRRSTKEFEFAIKPHSFHKDTRVPQGSVLGPLLSLLYAARIFDIIASFGLSGHTYANDSQLYIRVPASESQTAATQLAACVKGLNQWMGSNRLKLDAEKTQLIWITTGQQLAKLTVTQLQLINSIVEFDSTTMNLVVVLDGQLSMSQQVSAVCRSCFYQLCQLKSDKSSLTREALHSLIQAFVHCRLDYCNRGRF